jgi:methyl-accepting chemotaxis protein
MIQSLTRAIASVSVRTRIVGIALIPVVGFLANGLSFTTGQKDVTSAFNNVEAASALSDASREFKIVAAPSSELIRNFEANHVLAAANFEKIAAAADAIQEDDITRVRQKLGELKLAFGYLAD